MKVVNPEEAKKVTETLEARYEEAKKVNHKTETPATEKEIIAYKVASGEWFDTGMCIKDAKTGKRIKDVMSFKI